MAKKKTDQRILDLILLAKKKKEAIGKAEKPNWKTNCSFSFSFDDRAETRINLQVETDLDKLVMILAFLESLAASFDKVSGAIGVAKQFSWKNFTYEDWRSDVETRITKIQLKKEKDALEVLEDRLSKLISPELRQQIELEEIESMLK